MLLHVLVVVLLGAQPGTGSTVSDVRATLAAARTEIEAYRAAGGKAGAPNHPALKWHTALWAYRERTPGSEAAAVATAEAIQLLIRGEFFDEARAKVDTVGVDDLAWQQRLAAYLYFDASARKDYARTSATLERVAAGTRVATIKSAALLELGRIQRRQGDLAAAVKTLESSRDAAPDSASSNEADGILYDISHLSVGLVAPSFSATLISGPAGQPIGLDTLRGRAVAIVFWGST